MNRSDSNTVTLAEPPRRLTRKQSFKWAGSTATPKYLRHAGGNYVALREVPDLAPVGVSNKLTRH